jgi:5'-nucleotidase
MMYWQNTLEAEMGYQVNPADMQGKFLSKILPEKELALVSSLPNREGFYLDLEVIEHSQEVMKELHEQFDVYIVSAAMQFPNSLKDKLTWLAEYFSFIPPQNVIFCNVKQLIKTDYLIDDHPKNLIGFSGTPLIFTSFNNVFETQFERVNNWLEVRERF